MELIIQFKNCSCSFLVFICIQKVVKKYDGRIIKNWNCRRKGIALWKNFNKDRVIEEQNIYKNYYGLCVDVYVR